MMSSRLIFGHAHVNETFKKKKKSRLWHGKNRIIIENSVIF